MPSEKNLFNLGQVSRHFGVLMTEGFVTKTLEVSYVDKEKRSFMYDQEGIQAIGVALSKHALECGNTPCAPSERPVTKIKPKTTKPAIDPDFGGEEEEEL